MICEFCLHYTSDSACNLGLNKPKGMTCREFGPGMKKFCSEPKDFVSPAQIVEMAVFFGFQRTELKKVKLMAAEAEKLRHVAENISQPM
jgi:hypothetical protein